MTLGKTLQSLHSIYHRTSCCIVGASLFKCTWLKKVTAGFAAAAAASSCNRGICSSSFLFSHWTVGCIGHHRASSASILISQVDSLVNCNQLSPSGVWKVECFSQLSKLERLKVWMFISNCNSFSLSGVECCSQLSKRRLKVDFVVGLAPDKCQHRSSWLLALVLPQKVTLIAAQLMSLFAKD